MRGHGGSNAVAGDTHDEGNKAGGGRGGGGGKRRENKKLNENHTREARHNNASAGPFLKSRGCLWWCVSERNVSLQTDVFRLTDRGAKQEPLFCLTRL